MLLDIFLRWLWHMYVSFPRILGHLLRWWCPVSLILLQWVQNGMSAQHMQQRWAFKEMWLVCSQMRSAICHLQRGVANLMKELDRIFMLYFLLNAYLGDLCQVYVQWSLDSSLWACLSAEMLLGSRSFLRYVGRWDFLLLCWADGCSPCFLVWLLIA